MTNRFQGLDLIDTVPEELWMEVRDTAQEAVIKTIPKKKKCKNAKWLSDAAAAAAKSLQLCLTLSNPIDSSPPGSSVPGILQARILEWVAISFSNACMHAKSLQSCPTLCDPMDSSPPVSLQCPWDSLGKNTGVGCHFLLQLSAEALQIAEKRREAKGKGEQERYTHLNAEFQRIARRDKKVLLSDKYNEIKENNRMGKTRDHFKKIRDTKGTFYAKMSTIKDKNSMDLTEAGFPRWFSGKESTCQCKRCRFNLWVRKIPWKRKWQCTPVFLSGKFHGHRSLMGYSPRGGKESDMTEHARKT